MKKIMIIIAVVATVSGASAQNFPEAGTSGLGFNVTGISNVMFGNFGSTAISGAPISDPAFVLEGYPVTIDALIPQNTLMYKRYYENGLASRLTLGINSISISTFMGDSTGFPLEYAETDEKVSGFTFGLGAGLEKHMETSATKVDPYLGAEIMFAMLTGVDYSLSSDITGDGYSTSFTQDVAYPGGLGFALNVLGGFNYFFSDNISIGGEVGLGFAMLNSGGEWTNDMESTFTTGGVTTTTTAADRGEYKNSLSGVNVNSYGGVNLIVYW